MRAPGNIVADVPRQQVLQQHEGARAGWPSVVFTPETGKRRGSIDGTCTTPNACSGDPSRANMTPRFRLRFRTWGNGWPGSIAIGVRMGKTSLRKRASRSASAFVRELGSA